MMIKIPRGKLTRDYIIELSKINKERTDETKELERIVLKKPIEQGGNYYEFTQDPVSKEWKSDRPIYSPTP